MDMEPNDLEDADDIAAVTAILNGELPPATSTKGDTEGELPKDDAGTQGERAAKPDKEGETDDVNDDQTDPKADTDSQATSKTQANPHKVIRTLRRSEQRLRDENERLKAQLEAAAKPGKTEQTAVGDDISDEDLAQLEADFPALAKLARANRKLRAELQTRPEPAKPAAAKTPTEDDFEPPVLPPDLQEIVDQIPDLQDWQHDPDQRLFTAAAAMDGFLQTHKQWKDKPLAERLQEVVRRVKAEEQGSSSQQQRKTTPTEPDPDEIERKAARATPRSLSDIGGQSARDTKDLSVERLRQMDPIQLAQHLQDLD